jgi:hypothetical protein
MAAAHILTKTEDTRTGADIMDRGTYRRARLREVAQLAWDLVSAVEGTKPFPETPDLSGAGLICEKCNVYIPMAAVAAEAAIQAKVAHRCGTPLTINR